MEYRTGFGYDLHRLETGYDFWLGGIQLDFEKGAIAYSDGDVLIHAIIDALLGAANLGDIGRLFPDNAEEFKDIDSKILLKRTFALLKEKSIKIIHIDSTIVLENPILAPYVDRMKKSLAVILEIETDRLSIKAKTNEKCDEVGKGNAVAAYAVSTIKM